MLQWSPGSCWCVPIPHWELESHARWAHTLPTCTKAREHRNQFLVTLICFGPGFLSKSIFLGFPSPPPPPAAKGLCSGELKLHEKLGPEMPVALKMYIGAHYAMPPNRIYHKEEKMQGGQRRLIWNSKTSDLLLALRTTPSHSSLS